MAEETEITVGECLTTGGHVWVEGKVWCVRCKQARKDRPTNPPRPKARPVA